MHFAIDSKPPTSEEIEKEKRYIDEASRRIKTNDTIISFVLIILTSALIGGAVYWSTGKISYAAIAFSVFPVIGVILGLTGLITTVGFRSNALRVIELKHELTALAPISADSQNEVDQLRRKYPQVDGYCKKVENLDRTLVNGELAMFWEWDATTQAKREKQRAYLEDSGKHPVKSDKEESNKEESDKEDSPSSEEVPPSSNEASPSSEGDPPSSASTA